MSRGRPSRTALGVASRIVHLGRDPRLGRVVPSGAAEMTERLLARVPAADLGASHRTGGSLLHRAWRLAERIAVPGMSLHLGVRKRFLEDHARRALAEGARQIVVLGAGFDTLAPRLAAERPAIACFELDHPSTQGPKGAALRAIGAATPNLHLIGCDLAGEGPLALLRDHAAFQREAPAFFVAEGLLTYFETRVVDRLLASMREIAPGRSRLGLTYVHVREDGSPILGRSERPMKWVLGRAGEPFRWGIRRGALAGFLEERGFGLIDAPGREDLRRRYLSGLEREPLLAWEHLAVAEVTPRGGRGNLGGL